MEFECEICGNNASPLYKEEGNPHEAIFCGTQCQSKYHNLGTIDSGVVAPSHEYKRWPFYLVSAQELIRLKREDIFAYLCLSHYGQQSAVNPILFKTEGNWMRFKDYMNLVPNFDRMMDPKDPYDIWDKFFKSMLKLAPGFGFPFTDRSDKIIITKKNELIRHYPEMRPYLEMADKVLFVRLYISAIQGVILNIPKQPFPFMAWRGYSPLAVPNSLSMNILNYQPGQQIINWGLASISLDHRISSSFADVDQACCMMYIQVPAGFPAFMLTSDTSDAYFPHIPTPYSQMEILLPPGTIFQIGNYMGRRTYSPYDKMTNPYDNVNIQISLETIEVYIVGIAKNEGYITPEKRFEMMAKQKMTVFKKDLHKRFQRLNTNKKILYHQTSPQAAEAIIASQTFFPGKTGLLGGGIYFASSISDTDRKAETKGVILEAHVQLGKIKTFTAPNRNVTFETLLAEGYDSSYIMMNSGPEYVVYDSDQVSNIRYASGIDIMNRELTLVYPGLKAAKVLLLVVGKEKGEKVAFIGRDAKTKRYRLFGGTHSKKRTRGDNVRREWCEEFGAFLKDQGMICDPPTVEQLKSMPKAFENGRLERGGPPRTNIVILMDVGNLNVSETDWNRNNQKLRANKNIPKEYKEIDKLSKVKLSALSQWAKSTAKGNSLTKDGMIFSTQLLQAVRDLI